MGSGPTEKQFWTRASALARLAEVRGSRFEGDTRERQLQRKARAVLDQEFFNRTYLPHYFRDAPATFHSQLYRLLEISRRAVVRAPRGHGKSVVLTFAHPLHQVACAAALRGLAEGTLATTDPELAAAIEAARPAVGAERRTQRDELLAWLDRELAAEGDPEVRVLWQSWRAELATAPLVPTHFDPYIQIIAVTLDQGLEFTEAIKLELEDNALLRSDWGELVEQGDIGRNYADFTANGTRVRAFGMRGSIRGGRHRQWRPTLAIVDDPDSEETTTSRPLRDKQMRKLMAGIRFGLEPERSRAILIGTPVHADCIVCRLTAPDAFERWAKLRFRARTRDGAPLWPERWSDDELAAEEREDPETFAMEMLDQPPSEGDRPFKRLHTYTPDLIDWSKLARVLAFDPALGKTNRSDYQAVVVLAGPTAEGKLLVRRGELLRISDPLQLVEHVNGLYAQETPDLAVLEAIGFQILLEVLLRLHGVVHSLFPGWVKIERQELAKDLRIRGLAPLVNNGTILFPDDGSCDALMRQFQEYPDGKVDGPDVTEMAVRMMRRQASGGLARQIRHGRGRGALFSRGAF